MAKVSIPKPKKTKINPKTIDVVFIRYALDNNINYFLVVNSEIGEISNNIIIEAKDVVYFENIFPFKFRVPSDPSSNPSISDIPYSSSALPTDPRPRRSKRTETLRNFREDFFIYLV